MLLRVTDLGDILISALHGYQVVHRLNGEPGPIFVCGNRGKHALELLLKSSVKYIRSVNTR